MSEPVSDEVRERIAERIEGALRSEIRPWREDPDGFYRSSADMLARWIIEQIEAAGTPMPERSTSQESGSLQPGTRPMTDPRVHVQEPYIERDGRFWQVTFPPYPEGGIATCTGPHFTYWGARLSLLFHNWLEGRDA